MAPVAKLGKALEPAWSVHRRRADRAVVVAERRVGPAPAGRHQQDGRAPPAGRPRRPARPAADEAPTPSSRPPLPLSVAGVLQSLSDELVDVEAVALGPLLEAPQQRRRQRHVDVGHEVPAADVGPSRAPAPARTGVPTGSGVSRCHRGRSCGRTPRRRPAPPPCPSSRSRPSPPRRPGRPRPAPGSRTARPGCSAVPLSRKAPTISNSRSTMAGARPCDISSTISSRGRQMSARARASICCSPPDSVPAACPSPPVERREGGVGLLDPPAGLGPVQLGQCRRQPQRLVDPEVGEDPPALGHVQEAPAGDPLGRLSGDVLAAEADGAGHRPGSSRRSPAASSSCRRR